MYIDTRYPIIVKMNGRVKQSGAWHDGRTLKINLLIYILGGDLTLRIGEKIYSGNAGSAFLIPAGVSYAPINASRLEYLFFHFDAPNINEKGSETVKIMPNASLPEGEYAYSYSNDTPPVILVPEHTEVAGDRRIHDLMERISALNVRTSSSEKMLLDCYLRELLVLLSGGMKRGLSRNLSTILGYIEKNYDSDLSLTSLSEALGFSRSYIARLFKNELKMTSSDYVNKIRIGIACDLLSKSDLRIGEISEKVGFSEQYYFSRVFHRICGVTPIDFRRKNSQMQL